MTIYTEKSNLTLLFGSTDPDGDPITVRRVAGQVPQSWPVSVDLPVGCAIVYETGRVDYDDKDDTASHPASGSSAANGSFDFTLWDGIDESPIYTASLSLTGISPAPPAPVAGAVASWRADTGVASSGGVVTAWTDQETGLVLPATDTPGLGTAPTGAATITLNGNDTFFKADGVGPLPVGAAARTLILAARVEPGSANWGGFSWGNAAVDESFGLNVDPSSEDRISLDWYGDRIAGPKVGDGAWFIATAVYDGTQATLYFGKTLIGTQAVALNTIGDRINVMRSFSGKARTGSVAAAYVYDTALDAAQVGEMVDFLREDIIGATQAPTLAAMSFTGTSMTTGVMKVTVMEPNVTVHGVLSASGTMPSAAQIKAGTDHSGAAALATITVITDEPGEVITHPVTGLTADTEYFAYFTAEEPFGEATPAVNTGVWLPTADDRLLMWADPADPAKTVIANGRMSQILDRSGNGRHLVQTSVGAQPTVGALGGTAILETDGTNDELRSTAAASWLGGTGYTLVTLTRRDGGAAATAVSTAETGGLSVGWSGSGTWQLAHGATSAAFPVTATGAPMITATVFENPGAKLFVDGALAGFDGVLPSAALSPGAALSVGQGTGTPGLNGAIGDVIVTASLDGAKRQRTEGYLAHKYGVTSALEAGHPYKTAPPVAIARGTTPATATVPGLITPQTLTFADDEPTGLITTFEADEPVDTWDQVAPLVPELTVESDGRLLLTSAMSAQSVTLNVRATNSGGSLTQSVPVEVTATSGTGADYTVPHWDALESLLNGWGGTVPDGRAVTVEVQGPTTNSTFSVTNRNFNHLVTVRAAGPYTLSFDGELRPTGGTGANWTGNTSTSFNLQGSSNIRFLRCKITIGKAEGLILNGSGGITFENCWLQGTPYAISSAQSSSVGVSRLARISGGTTTGLAFKDCLFAYTRDTFVNFGASASDTFVDCSVVGCVGSWPRGDEYKFLGNTTDFAFSRNWSSRRLHRFDETHTDFLQFQNGHHVRFRCYGNMAYRPHFERGGNRTTYQPLFGNGNGAYMRHTNCDYEQNIIAANAVNSLFLNSAGGYSNSGCKAQDNDVLRIETGAVGEAQGNAMPKIGNGFATKARNLVTVVASGNDGGQGANGVKVAIGNPKTDDANFNLYAASGYWEGYPSERVHTLTWLEPPSAAVRSHWNHSGTKVGAATRKKEIFVDGLVPGNAGWPVDAAWYHQWNANGAVSSAYTGAWDAEGAAT